MGFRNRNGNNLNPLTRIYWRASLVPAAAVIPAPKVYIKVAAVKKLVVGSGQSTRGGALRLLLRASGRHYPAMSCMFFIERAWRPGRLL